MKILHSLFTSCSAALVAAMYSPIKPQILLPSFSHEKAKETRKYCMECACPGFPYCFSRVYPKQKLNSPHIKNRIKTGEKICKKCGCTTCKYRKKNAWNSCKFCRQWYLSDLHCR